MKIGGKNVSVLMVGVFAVAAYFLAGYMNLLPASVFPIQPATCVNVPFTIRFFIGPNEYANTVNCLADPEMGTAFLIQQITVTDDTTGQVVASPFPTNGYPTCVYSTPPHQWPDYTFTPTELHQYTVRSEIRDGTNDNVILVDEFIVTAQDLSSPACQECTPGQTQCDFGSDPDRLKVCSSDGYYTLWGDFCPAGCVDPGNGDAYCVGVCTPGEYRCIGEVQYEYCNNDGSNWDYSSIATCPFTQPLPTTCIEGQSQPCHQAQGYCGDGICYAETTATCPQDCPPTGPVCGNGVCESDAGETASSCYADCGECSGDPDDMDLETLCRCYPNHTSCTDPHEEDNIDDWIWSALIIGGIVGGGLLIYMSLSKGGRRRKR